MNMMIGILVSIFLILAIAFMVWAWVMIIRGNREADKQYKEFVERKQKRSNKHRIDL